MILECLIKWLEEKSKQYPEGVVPYGFDSPDSYRGYYQDLAFEPKENARISDMLEHARGAVGVTFTGYKGGEYEMNEETECWIAEYGSSEGDSIGPTLLKMWEYTLERQ